MSVFSEVEEAAFFGSDLGGLPVSVGGVVVGNGHLTTEDIQVSAPDGDATIHARRSVLVITAGVIPATVGKNCKSGEIKVGGEWFMVEEIHRKQRSRSTDVFVVRPLKDCG